MVMTFLREVTELENTLRVTLDQALVFFIFMAVGFIFCRTKCVAENTSKVISQVLMNVVLPGLCFKTFSQNMTVANLGHNLKYLICGAVLVVVMFAVAYPLGRAFSRRENTVDIYRYALCVPNVGYFGYPMIQAVFGEQALTDAMVFTIPINLFIFTVAQYMLDPKKKFTLKKLLNPTVISMAAGIAVGMSGLRMPEIVMKVCGGAADCMSPLAMIMTGFVLAKIPLGKLLTNARAYLVTLLRLVVIPALIFGALRLLRLENELVFIAATMYAMPVGLNAVVFPEAFGGDSRTGAQVCFISTACALLTLPLVFMALRRLAG